MATHSHPGIRLFLITVLSLTVASLLPDRALAEAGGGKDLSEMSLENLAGLDVTVTSASKKAESLLGATAAIFVITQEDIQASGARTLPDLLFMVPGVQVNRQSANEWAISARGFNAQYNNKMLVLIDGRSVYDPVFGGVDWSQQDLPLVDVDHIEVIRGPGGTLWGSNAVYGIVNIITKDAKLTQGFISSTVAASRIYPSGVSGPSALAGGAVLRYGGKLSEETFYRVYLQGNNQNPFVNPKADLYEAALGETWNDAWHDLRGGFRADLHSGQDHLTLEGDVQKGWFNYARLTTDVTSFFDPKTFVYGNDLNTNIAFDVNLLARWTRDFEDGSQLQVLGYFDHRNLSTAKDDRSTNVNQLDLEFQHRFRLGDWNEVTWGGNFRNIADQFKDPINIYFSPDEQELNIYSGFLQDRVTLAPERLFVTLGLKLENNPFTGTEWQPSGRVLFTPDERNSLWGAVSRAVRIPYQIGDSAYIYLAGVPQDGMGPGTPPVDTYSALVPNPDLASETLLSYEFGYRTSPSQDLSLDLAAFYNHYEGLFSFESLVGTYPSPAGGVIDSSLGVVQAQNTGTGNIYGVELSVKWEPLADLKLNGTYTYQDYDRALIAASNIEMGAVPPHHLANLWGSFKPVPELELDTALYFTADSILYDSNSIDSVTKEFLVWNLGVTFRPHSGLALSLWGMDLQGAHSETLRSAFISPAQVVPTVYGKLTLEY